MSGKDYTETKKEKGFLVAKRVAKINNASNNKRRIPWSDDVTSNLNPRTMEKRAGFSLWGDLKAIDRK